jgi:hypothetical protein
MKNKLPLILLFFTYRPLPAQPHLGFEQYYCTGATAGAAPVTRVYYQGNGKGYVEARYNYDAERTAGLSVGRSFDAPAGKALAWTLTPTIGWMAGDCHGLSLGANVSVEYKGWDLSTAAQVSPAKQTGYWYSWSEVGRPVGNRLYVGVALQQDCRFGAGCTLTPGIQGRLLLAQWTFPVYIFNPLNNGAWLLAGVTREWTGQKKIADHKKILAGL